ICIPVVSAIIERRGGGKKGTEVLIQTRWKPRRDPQYSGTIEMPVGWMNRYEDVFSALRREVFEETGLYITKIRPANRTKQYAPRNDGSFAFVPFCCIQQTKGGKPWVGFVFICEVENKQPTAQADEVRDVRWIKKSELRKMMQQNPKQFFTRQLGALDFYLSTRRRI
ncbi:NUDIX hydrolase, partial [Candidatus Uhrbacteria bacterium]|nr:NUDIX hydrolase [Candidatus Uhrbacteria bacterium]